MLHSRNLSVALPRSQVTSHAPLPCHAGTRGTHALTFRQYSSYSVPNIFRSVGSSYNRTNRATPRTTAIAAAISALSAWPKITHSPAHPAKNPKYIGFRTYRSNPTTTSFFGGATGAGVPRPVHPKSHTHRSVTLNPSTENTAAIHRHPSAPASPA